MSKTVYLAGGISGVPNYRDDFCDAAALLREGGYTVINPVELDERDGTQNAEWIQCMWRDIKEVATSKPDECWVLPTWRNSKGAQVEVGLFRGLGLPVIDYETKKELSEETICQEAQRIVCGDRGAAYGPPERDFARTAKIWEAILGCDVTPEQVGLCMIGVKVSRQAHKPKRDNLTDICGYALTVQMINDAGAK